MYNDTDFLKNCLAEGKAEEVIEKLQVNADSRLLTVLTIISRETTQQSL